ncbi:MAG: MarR family transcriptional regulator [Armatimonas sp.]
MPRGAAPPHGGTLAPFELNPGHFAVMSLLYSTGARSQKQLIDALNIDKSTMVILIDQLERGDFAIRQPDTRDCRAHAVSLTEIGRERFEILGVLVARIQANYFSPLTSDELETLRTLLLRLKARQL